MTNRELLDVVSDFAQIFTAGLAAWAWFSYKLKWRRKVKVLEDHLREQKDVSGGVRTSLHLQAQTGLTESEIFQASFDSQCIKRQQDYSKDGNTIGIRYTYVEPTRRKW